MEIQIKPARCKLAHGISEEPGVNSLGQRSMQLIKLCVMRDIIQMSVNVKSASSPGVDLAPGLAGEGLQKGLAELEQHRVEGDKEGVVGGLARVHLHLAPLRVAGQRQRQPAQHALPGVLDAAAGGKFSQLSIVLAHQHASKRRVSTCCKHCQRTGNTAS